MADFKVINQENVSYHFMVNGGKLLAIGVTDEEGVSRKFSIEAENSEDRLTTDFFETAMEALLRAKPDEFDLVSLVVPKPYSEVAVKVYKKVMDELYNLPIADVAFKRHISSFDEALKATYTLFEKE